ASSEETVRVSQAMEDYLKAAYRLEQEGGPVSTQRLADELGISGPSVTNMVKRLDELKLLKHSRYHGVTLTPSGQHVALEVIRHHRLLELYLAEALGFDWDEVHAEAERLEHHVSEELERRMEKALGYPQFDPHGDPIPSRTGTFPEVDDIALPDVPAGKSAQVSRVSDRDPDHLRHLASLGVKPGVTLDVIEHLPFDGPIRVTVDGVEQLLSLTVARGVRLAHD
ncbi:MAG TPA: metal-dependent transcriptional regulator, partial [Thermomicrobiales bacterium]|nr:metal-dependent transcriptional regulator [Thermomicrobiales bacterium]